MPQRAAHRRVNTISAYTGPDKGVFALLGNGKNPAKTGAVKVTASAYDPGKKRPEELTGGRKSGDGCVFACLCLLCLMCQCVCVFARKKPHTRTPTRLPHPHRHTRTRCIAMPSVETRGESPSKSSDLCFFEFSLQVCVCVCVCVCLSVCLSVCLHCSRQVARVCDSHDALTP